MKILVADDSKTMQRIIGNVLKRLNREDVDFADNGQSALDLFKKNKYDVVLTDQNMPYLTGTELIVEIRKKDKKIPIIMITTEGGKNEVIKALRLGANSYIVKPFTPDVLKEKLSNFML